MNIDANDLVSIVISCQPKNSRRAERLREIFGLIGNRRARCRIIQEKTEDKQWYEIVTKELANANTLVCLSTEPIPNWDGVVYQTGVADGRNESDEVKTIATLLCHQECDVPSTVKQRVIKVVKGSANDQEEIKQFLTVFSNSDQLTGKSPLYPDFCRTKELPQFAHEISNWFVPTGQTHEIELVNTLTFIEAEQNSITEASIPDDMIVQGSERALLDIFGVYQRLGDDWKWSEIMVKAEISFNSLWVRELGEALYEASNGGKVKPLMSVYRAGKDRLYSPVVYKVIETANFGKKFIVLFTPEPIGKWVPGHSMARKTLLTALHLGNRLDTEVCDSYIQQFEWPGNDISKLLVDIKNKIITIDKDAKLREEFEAPDGPPNLIRLIESFSNIEDKNQIRNNMGKQEKLKNILRSIDAEAEVEKRDYEKHNEIKDALIALQRYNLELTTLVSRRYDQLLNNRYKELQPSH